MTNLMGKKMKRLQVVFHGNVTIVARREKMAGENFATEGDAHLFYFDCFLFVYEIKSTSKLKAN